MLDVAETAIDEYSKDPSSYSLIAIKLRQLRSLSPITWTNKKLHPKRKLHPKKRKKRASRREKKGVRRKR